MDSIKQEKYQSMVKYNKYYTSFLSSLIRLFLLLVMLGLFLSSPLWLPSLCSSMKLFFIESLPRIAEVILGPKSLFLVFNLIIIFLVGESRISSSSSKPDIYEEYATRTQGLKGVSSREYKGTELALVSPMVKDMTDNGKKEKDKDDEEKQEERVEMEDEEVIEEEDNDVLEEEEEDEEERGPLAEELNKRVEDFIARVNMQRRLETRMMVCCG